MAISPAVPTLPLTVPDVVCILDVDPNDAETTSDLQTLEQDVFHMLIETLGSNIDDPTRGIGVEELLSGTVAEAQKAPARVDQQLAQDDRIDSSTTSLDLQPDGSYILALEVRVGGQVLGLSYGYSASSGLTPLP